MWKISSLEEISEIIQTGKTPPTSEKSYFEGGINWFTPGDLDTNKYLNYSNRTISEKALQEKKAVAFAENTILITCIGEIGKVGITSQPSSSNQQITGIKPKAHIHPEYLYYWVIANKPYLNSIANNAVVPILNNGNLKKIAFKYPPLETQIKIANALDKADSIRQKDKQIIQKYDELLQSVFLEMFGDPVRNEKGWKVESLKNLGILKSGGTPTRTNPDFFKGKIPWITTVALGPKVINETHAVEYITEEAILKSATKLIPKGSIMIGVRVGVGKASILGCDMCSNQDILSLAEVKSTINKNFLLEIFHYYESYFNSQKRGATIQGITSETIKELNIIIPPLELQNTFSLIVKSLESQKAKAQQSLQKSEELFNSLLQKAFKGELFD